MSAIGDEKTTDTATLSQVDSLPAITHVQVTEKVPVNSEPPNISHGNGESEDKFEESVEPEDDWENDPENARNWPNRKKWTAVCIVRRFHFFWEL